MLKKYTRRIHILLNTALFIGTKKIIEYRNQILKAAKISAVKVSE